ncbi:MAG: hypothetical protein WCJ60_01645 [bacterium]
MGISISDLMPKDFKVTVKGLELDCKPLRLSHALIVGKLSDVFSNPINYTANDIRQAEKDIDSVITDLIPELTGVKLDIASFVELMPQMMNSTQPQDEKDLVETGIQLGTDPKVLA